jgi:hypothetical protein
MNAYSRLRDACHTRLTLTILLLLAGAGGCATPWKNPPSAFAQNGNTATIEQPSLKAMETVKRVVTSPPINLPIEREEGGSIYTGYQSFPGRWHILRRWQERTHYRIDVTPDFTHLESRSKVEVWEETETRAASNQKFDRDTELRYPERAKKLLDQIVAGAAGGPATAPAQ